MLGQQAAPQQSGRFMDLPLSIAHRKLEPRVSVLDKVQCLLHSSVNERAPLEPENVGGC